MSLFRLLPFWSDLLIEPKCRNGGAAKVPDGHRSWLYRCLSPSALIHHLYIFDAAVTEFGSQALSDSSTILNSSDGLELPVES